MCNGVERQFSTTYVTAHPGFYNIDFGLRKFYDIVAPRNKSFMLLSLLGVNVPVSNSRAQKSVGTEV